MEQQISNQAATLARALTVLVICNHNLRRKLQPHPQRPLRVAEILKTKVTAESDSYPTQVRFFRSLGCAFGATLSFTLNFTYHYDATN